MLRDARSRGERSDDLVPAARADTTLAPIMPVAPVTSTRMRSLWLGGDLSAWKCEKAPELFEALLKRQRRYCG